MVLHREFYAPDNPHLTLNILALETLEEIITMLLILKLLFAP